MSNVKNYFNQPTADGDNILDLNGTWKIDGVEVTATANSLNTITPAGVTSTAAEINLLDLSAQTETLTTAGAVSIIKRITKVAITPAGGAITLAAPDATMLGQVKIIEMTVDNGDVTLALTNVQGGSAATTATFSAVGQCLVLVAGISKWNVCSEGGVVLS